MAGDSQSIPVSVFGLWRYPVKSMAGEEVSAATVTPRGLLGDRAYALVDRVSNRAATVQHVGSGIVALSCPIRN
jgi:uncharacterized protein YcbX